MDSTPEKQDARTPYQAPALISYGDLARITNALSATGMNADGGGPFMNKTN